MGVICATSGSMQESWGYVIDESDTIGKIVDETKVVRYELGYQVLY